MAKPSAFVGSSSEGLEVARAIEFQLKDDAEVTIWTEGVFGLGLGSLESLTNALDRFDFAILVLTPDDFTMSRDAPALAPRDNVMFELGLFIGRLGRSRTFMVCSDATTMKLPSDLAGVTVARFDSNRTDNNLIAALGPACTLIRRAISDLGFAEFRSLKQLQTATNQVEEVSHLVASLVFLLARSRILELDIITKQFADVLPPGLLEAVRHDLRNLEEVARRKERQ